MVIDGQADRALLLWGFQHVSMQLSHNVIDSVTF